MSGDHELDVQLEELQRYTACDISDALLKLKVPGAGFLADLVHRNPTKRYPPPPLLAPASTVLFLPKSPSPPPSALPTPTLHFADQISPHSVIVISQPPGQTNAVVGGIVATRLKLLGSRAVVVDGRVRDLAQLSELGDMPIFSLGTSTVGAGAASVAHAINVPITLSCGVTVNPGDIIFLTTGQEAAVVCIPRGLIPQILQILPAMVDADRRALEDVYYGVTITEALRKHRGA